MVVSNLVRKITHQGLRAQLILGITFIIVMSISLFVMDLVSRQNTFFLKLNHDRGVSLSENLANIATSHVVAYELEGLQKLVASYKKMPGLEYAMITSYDGIVLSHTNEKYRGLRVADTVSAKLKPVNTTQVLIENNDVFDVASPIMNHDEIVGWARIGLSQKEMGANVAEIKKRGLLYILLSLIVGIIFAIIVSTRLTNGLQKLITVAQNIKMGNRDLRANSSKSFEVTQLGTAFNQMLDDISSNEKLLSQILENMPIGVFILDECGKVIRANPAGQEMWKGVKYVGVDDYNIYKAWFTDTGREVQNHEWGAAIVLDEGRAVLDQEIEIECFDKSHKIILNSAIPLRDVNEKITGIITINVDITEHKKAEAKIRERESQLTALFDNMEGATSLLDTEKKYVLFNKRFIQDHKLLSGHDPYVGQLVYDFLPPDLLEKRLELLDNVLKGNREVVEADHVRDGKRVYFRSSFSPVITDGKVTGISTFSLDLTKSKEAEMKIRENEEKLSLFIEHSPASLAMFDAEMKYIATSRRWMNDYNLGNQNIIGKTHYEIFPEVSQEWKDIHQRCLKGAIERREEDSFTRVDGTTDWLRWEIRPWHKSTGEIGGIIMFTEVITERKRAEMLLERSEEKNRALIENITDAIVLLNANNQVIYQSPSAEHITGYSFEDRTKGEAYEFVYKEDLPQVAEMVQKAMQEPGVPFSYQVRLNHKAGRIIWIEATILNLLHNESVKALVVTYHDVTDRKNAQKALEQSEEKNRALIENISDTIVLVNEKLEVIYQSPSFTRTAGLTLDDHKGKTVLQVMHPDELDECLGILHASKISPDVAIPFQLRTLHKDGHYIWVEGTVTNLLQNDNVKAFVLNYRDITERKNAEKEKAETLEQLKRSEDQIREFAKYLQTAREEERTDIAREIHDELGQQLTGLKMYISTLTRKLRQTDPTIEEKIVEINQLIDETVKSVRKISSNLRPGVLDDLGLVAALEWQTLEFEKRTGISCKASFKLDEKIVDKNMATAVFRIYQESLTNIMRYAKATQVIVSLSANDIDLLLTIKDNGIGFDLEKQKNKKTLGLLGMQERARIFDGKVMIGSEAGGGTTITLTIPIAIKQNNKI